MSDSMNCGRPECFIKSIHSHETITKGDTFNHRQGGLELDIFNLQTENAALRARIERLKGAMDKIVNFPRIFSDESRDCMMVKAMDKIAKQALSEDAGE